ncbi:MAG: efflux RND transporter permease subunit [Alphaproteobacteria bacterium]|nr:efflux RND transporter permease subunit [Alphaproteobacteria bacterium]
MSFSATFIKRPVATTLLTLGIALSGAVAFFLLPVAPLPQVDFPTILVEAGIPGASPETMATSVATPLERHLGQIADVAEMTSTSTIGNARITLQFGLDRDIDGAARDVQAAINAARADLPSSLKSNPTYHKLNPADAPILILALTSQTMTPGQIYDAGSTVLAQKLSQIKGVGQVRIGGSSLPAVRVELNPRALSHYGIGLEDVRAALAAANANSPKGALEEQDRHFQLYTNDQALHADDYRNLIIAWRNSAPVRLGDVAEVKDSVEDLRNQGLFNGKPAVILIVTKQPGANVIDTIDRIKAELPNLKASIPSAIALTVALDRTTTIRASLRDVESSMLISTFLVIMVVFLFLRNARAAMIPSVAVPVSMVGTFGIMYLLDYSLDNLSLMAMTIATGFVVDDAIVVLENVMRHIERGMPHYKAAAQGAKEVGFTVLSMSLSLIAVFTPILLMGGIVGRLFHEFAVTLSVAILVSLLVSLTATPMMCSRWLGTGTKHAHAGKAPLPTLGGRGVGVRGAMGITHDAPPHPNPLPPRGGRGNHRSLLNRIFDLSENGFTRLRRAYDLTLMRALRHRRLVMLILAATLGLNVYLFIVAPKGFFPQQDTGGIMGNLVGDQNISFQAMKKKMIDFVGIVQKDSAVDTVTAFTGGGSTNSGFLFMSLKPKAERNASADQVIARLRKPMSRIPGATLFLQSAQDLHMGGRAANAQYQYTLQSDSLAALREWTPKLTEALQHDPLLRDVNSDQQDAGMETDVIVDRDTASRLGLNTMQIDNALYDAFGQRQVSVIYNTLNQYHVVMEVAPEYWQSPETLKELFISTSGGSLSGTEASSSSLSAAARAAATNALAATGHGGAMTGAAVSTTAETMIPLSAFSAVEASSTPLSVNHQGHFASSTISFNLPVGKSLSDATTAINNATRKIDMPANVTGGFQGTAQVFQQSLANEPILILAALLAVYIVLGILYESLIHPLTILSTLPSAGVGAVAALMLFHIPFDIMGMIGVILLIGIVKKNAIMMIDFALDAQRTHGLTPQQAIYRACLLRFRPIMMTTMAAMFGALPLAIGLGEGAELRRPLGISIVGGLLVSQLLTLFTTPVIYLYLDRFSRWCRRRQGVGGRVQKEINA